MPRRVMIEPGTPVVVKEARLQERRQIELKRDTHLEFIDLFYIEIIVSLGCLPSPQTE